MTWPLQAAPVVLFALVIPLVVLGGGRAALAGGVCPCEGDVNANGVVDGEDLGDLLAVWGECSDCLNCAGDLSGD